MSAPGAVNYETFSFAANPQGEQQPTGTTTTEKGRRRSSARGRSSPKHQVVALVLSKSGPLAAEQWKTVTPLVVYTLQEELGLRRSLSIPRRFLDETNASENDGLVPTDHQSTTTPEKPSPSHPCRILELSIPLPQKTPLPDLAQCSVISKALAIVSLCQRNDIELVIQPHSLYLAHRTPGLAVFDMDSTLIQQEVIDELARAVGRYAEVSAITEAAMRGEAPYTDFEASLRARVGLLAGVPTSIWDHLRTGIITFTPGARELLRMLKKLGWKTAVLSGGFTPLAMWVKSELGLDYCFANHLVESNGVLTGELVAGMPIIHATKKRELLEEIANAEGIPLDNVIAVGDGSNDLLMMHKAGLGIAFNAKPKVQLQAPVKLNAAGLLDVGYILGYSVDEVTELSQQGTVW
ncbi:hypothetical protein AAFC00_007220 [Neodothiora populina]|uniref:phosphoserine phosphatase n=1 Tax=Neodothiora populina TaxID=2781224 RepID=A0ABR3PHM4_9PEZI